MGFTRLSARHYVQPHRYRLGYIWPHVWRNHTHKVRLQQNKRIMELPKGASKAKTGKSIQNYLLKKNKTNTIHPTHNFFEIAPKSIVSEKNMPKVLVDGSYTTR